jgi:hypothetical protein
VKHSRYNGDNASGTSLFSGFLVLGPDLRGAAGHGGGAVLNDRNDITPSGEVSSGGRLWPAGTSSPTE